MTASAIYTGNTSAIIAEGLKDRDGTAITNATVQVVALVDNRGRDVTGITLPLAMGHIGAGTYQGSIPAELGIVPGQVYKATITAVTGGQSAEWVETLIAQVRVA